MSFSTPRSAEWAANSEPRPKGLDRSDREINIGYRCVMAPRSIVLIGQSDFNGAGRSKDRRNDLACNTLVAGAHLHYSDEVHLCMSGRFKDTRTVDRNMDKG